MINNTKINEVMRMGVPREIARHALQLYNWNVSRAINAFYEGQFSNFSSNLHKNPFFQCMNIDLLNFVKPDPISRKDQKEFIEEVNISSFKDGDVSCIISESWMKKLEAYVRSRGDEIPHPGPIDNQNLIKNFGIFYKWLENNSNIDKSFESKLSLFSIEERKTFYKSCPIRALELKNDLVLGEHYRIITSIAFEMLMKWYGGFHHGFAQSIPRVSYDVSIEYNSWDEVELDLYPLMIECALLSKEKKKIEEIEYKFDMYRFPRVMEIFKTFEVVCWYNNINYESHSGMRCFLTSNYSPPFKEIDTNYINVRLIDYDKSNTLRKNQFVFEHKDSVLEGNLLDENPEIYDILEKKGREILFRSWHSNDLYLDERRFFMNFKQEEYSVSLNCSPGSRYNSISLDVFIFNEIRIENILKILLLS